MTDKPAKQVSNLSDDAFERGRSAATGYDFPDSLAIGASAGSARTIETAWRAGFAAGWAARDTRDDEPPMGTWVWVIDNEGSPYVAIRAGEHECSWGVSGRPEPMTWREILEDAREWGRLDKVD